MAAPVIALRRVIEYSIFVTSVIYVVWLVVVAIAVVFASRCVDSSDGFVRSASSRAARGGEALTGSRAPVAGPAPIRPGRGTRMTWERGRG